MAKSKSKSPKGAARSAPDAEKKGLHLSEKHQDYIFIALIIIVLVVLLKPLVVDGLMPQGVDVVADKGKTHQTAMYNQTHDDLALWNPFLFSGMPHYHNYGPLAYSMDNLLNFFSRLFSSVFVFYLIGALGMYALLRYLKFSPLIALGAALIFILMPHYKSLWLEGHFKKFRAIFYIPWMVLAFRYFLDKRSLLGMALFALAFGLQIRTQHYQIVFYSGLLIFAIGVYPFLKDLLEKKYALFVKSTAMLLVAIVLGILMAAQPLFLSHEYLPYSKRGKTTIDVNANEAGQRDAAKSDGVELGYATQWSTHPAEMLTWLIPRFYGGMSAEKYSGTEVRQARGQMIASYWGHMPFTQSYEYMGAAVLLLALLGMYAFRKDKMVISLALFALFLIILSWGRHFLSFYELFYHYVPYFNKFRAPMMSVTVTFFIVALFAAYGLQYLISLASKRGDWKAFKPVWVVILIFLLLGVLVWLFSQGFTFVKEAGERYQAQSLDLVKLMRKEMFYTDLTRYFILIVFSGGLIAGYLLKKINSVILAVGLLLLIAVDLVNIQSRVKKELIDMERLEKQYFRPTSTDQFLLADEDLFRVFPSGQLFGDNRWVYHHQSIGGYTPIKMYVVEELVEKNIYNGPDRNLPINWNVLKILNVKYVIIQQALEHEKLQLVHSDEANQLYTYRFVDHLPRGFFVKKYQVINDEFERLRTINHPEFDPEVTAILEEVPQTEVNAPDSSFSRLKEFSINYSIYEVYTDKPALFVLSEVDYPPGWKMYIDGEGVHPLYRTNHAIQSVVVPEGNHVLELRFEPESFSRNIRLSYASLSVIYLIIVISLFFGNRDKIRNLLKR